MDFEDKDSRGFGSGQAGYDVVTLWCHLLAMPGHRKLLKVLLQEIGDSMFEVGWAGNIAPHRIDARKANQLFKCGDDIGNVWHGRSSSLQGRGRGSRESTMALGNCTEGGIEHHSHTTGANSQTPQNSPIRTGGNRAPSSGGIRVWNSNLRSCNQPQISHNGR